MTLVRTERSAVFMIAVFQTYWFKATYCITAYDRGSWSSRKCNWKEHNFKREWWIGIIFSIGCVIEYYVCKLNTTNACLLCLSLGCLPTTATIPLNCLPIKLENKRTWVSPSMVNQAVFQVWADLWSQITQRTWRSLTLVFFCHLIHVSRCAPFQHHLWQL